MALNHFKKIVIIAGESSGELYGAQIISNIKKKDPSCQFYGTGGNKMAEQNVHLWYHIHELAVMGLNIMDIIRIRKIFYQVLNRILQLKCDCVICINYSEFNIRLIKKLQELHISVFYYAGPSVWIHSKNRMFVIQKYATKLFVIFPFEKEFYNQHGVYNVEYVGHPILEELSKYPIIKSDSKHSNAVTIGFFPGSRTSELERHAPIFLKAAEEIHNIFPNIKFIISKTKDIHQDTFNKFFNQETSCITKVFDECHDAMVACDMAVAVSGTVTLQLGLLQKPMVVIYKVSRPFMLLVSVMRKLSLLKYNYFCIINIIFNALIVPEVFLHNTKTDTIVDHVIQLIQNKEKNEKMLQAFRKLEKILKYKDMYPSDMVSKTVLESISKKT